MARNRTRAVVDRLVQVARRLTPHLMALPGAAAVAVDGSLAGGCVDERSDLDLHVYCSAVPAPEVRRPFVHRLADPTPPPDVAVPPFGNEDHFFLDGVRVEAIFLPIPDLWQRIYDAWTAGTPGSGCSTTWFYTLQHSQVLADPSGALHELRQALRTFPPRLRERLVSWNVALAWHYLEHLETALQRADWPFFTDRLARLLAAYFDALFALNERFHPGEKRLLAYAAGCERAPADHQRRLARLVDPSTGAAERVDLARDLLRDLAGLSP